MARKVPVTTPPVHEPGPGLKVVGDPKQPWYGGGYCAICGGTGESLVPVRVRFWDCDDGWKTGVLCSYCGIEAACRGPKPTDYAVVTADPESKAALLDVLDEVLAGDDDGAQTESEELGP
jgi:hypothetical protein